MTCESGKICTAPRREHHLWFLAGYLGQAWNTNLRAKARKKQERRTKHEDMKHKLYDSAISLRPYHFYDFPSTGSMFKSPSRHPRTSFLLLHHTPHLSLLFPCSSARSHECVYDGGWRRVCVWDGGSGGCVWNKGGEGRVGK